MIVSKIENLACVPHIKIKSSTATDKQLARPKQYSISPNLLPENYCLSNHHRIPVTKIAPLSSLEVCKNTMCKDSVFKSIDASPPVKDEFGLNAVLGKVYYEKFEFAIEKRDRILQIKLNKSIRPGPMQYNSTQSFNYTRRKSSKNVPLFTSSHNAHNKCLAKKRYFEEKARDARDEHDDLKLASYNLVEPKIYSPYIADSKSVKN